MAKRKTPRYGVFWTWGNYRLVPTLKRAEHALKAWKWRYERMGWDVFGTAKAQVIAVSPTGERHAIVLDRELTPDQLQALRRARSAGQSAGGLGG